MPALILEGEKVDLSYNFDTLTVYPKFPKFVDDLISCINKCGQLPFVMKAPKSPGTGFSDDLKTLYSCLKQPESSKLFQRYVHADHDDHDLYHQDDFSRDETHHHLKFSRSLTREELFQVIDLFEKSELLITEQKESFMAAFDRRYAEIRNRVDNIFSSEEKTADFQEKQDKLVNKLLVLIQRCVDNDKLPHLHAYLLNNKFDVLRKLTQKDEGSIKKWQGTNSAGESIKTSSAWARLEKALSLQMIMNLQDQCQRFTPRLGEERAKQLAQSHRFFAIKRSQPLPGINFRVNKTLTALVNADESILYRKYNKVFGRT